jgi:hypothetical protein
VLVVFGLSVDVKVMSVLPLPSAFASVATRNG